MRIRVRNGCGKPDMQVVMLTSASTTDLMLVSSSRCGSHSAFKPLCFTARRRQNLLHVQKRSQQSNWAASRPAVTPESIQATPRHHSGKEAKQVSSASRICIGICANERPPIRLGRSKKPKLHSFKSDTESHSSPVASACPG